MSRRAAMLAIPLAAVALGAVRANDGVLTPTARERSWVASCLARTEAAGVAAAQAACAGKVTAACLGLERAPRLPPVPGRNSHPRTCAPVEEQIWSGLIAKVRERLPAARRGGFDARQRRWDETREAKCSALAEASPWPLGLDEAAGCSLHSAAERALRLRREASRRRS